METAGNEFRVEPIERERSAENVALAREVGWPDTAADWDVMHAGAIVLGITADGALVGQGALGLYGSVGTIAKMIVSPRFQRRGLGLRVLDGLLDEAQCRSMTVLGLVATPYGRPLYERRQFHPVGEVVGLGGVAVGVTEGASTRPLDDVEGAIFLDRSCLGCSREAMLRARFRHAIATSCIQALDGGLEGYALATSQGEHAVIGPVVAHTEEQARALVSTVLSTIVGPVRMDVPGEQTSFRQWLCGLGLREQKLRSEMAFGSGRLPWQVPARFGLAAQAWG